MPKINYKKVSGIKQILTSSFEIDSNGRTNEKSPLSFSIVTVAVASSLSIQNRSLFSRFLFTARHNYTCVFTLALLLFFFILFILFSFIINFTPFVQRSGFSIHSQALAIRFIFSVHFVIVCFASFTLCFFLFFFFSLNVLILLYFVLFLISFVTCPFCNPDIFC